MIGNVVMWEPFRYWCQKVLPAVYDDSLSYYELLCKVVKWLNELGESFNEMCKTIEGMESEIGNIRTELNNIIEYINNLFDSGMEEAASEWLQNNLEWFFDRYVKQIYFGLTLNGYFVAYIPEGWDDIIFDTGYNYGEDTYGRLILRWDVDDSGYHVNQRPENWR